MGVYNSPQIVLDNLVLNLDAGNIKSYAGDAATPAGPAYGYVGGGSSPTASSIVDRIDYGNDTATAAVKGPLSVARIISAAAGNASYAYFGGGSNPQISTVERIDYSNDTPTAAVKGPLAAARNYHTATGNASYGYFAGGDPGPKSTIQRIDYSNDTATAASGKGPLSSARNYLGSTGNQSYGYFAAGADPNTSTIDRLDYSSDTTTAAVKGPLTSIRRQLSATGNSSYGYFGGGRSGPGASQVTTVDRVDYSSDTPTASPKGPLTLVSYWGAATGSSSYGYFALGGGPDPYYLSLVDRIDYSSDTPTATAKGPLSAGRRGIAAASGLANGLPNSATYAYRSASIPLGTPYAWIVGGAPGNITSFERIDYDNDTATTSTRGALSGAKPYGGGVGNISYAYIGGGYSGSNLSTIDRIDYSNDNTTAPAKGPLSLARRAPSAAGNADYGYFGGGNIPSPATVYTTVDRVDYSNDTATAAVKGPLTIARTAFGATGNQSYGYFCCCSYYPGPENSSVDRIDYSSDTPTASPKGPLTVARGYIGFGAAGNSSYGYISGGFKYPPGTRYSTVERIDYSNDTPTAVAKGPMSAEITGPGEASSASYGYFAGGSLPAGRSTVDRLDYASDTTACATKGPLSQVKYNCPGVSSKNYGLPATSTVYPWNDASGKGNTAENSSGGVTYSSTGGGSFTFNGSSNYVSDDDKSDLKLGTSDFTLAAWIRPGATTATEYGYFGGGQAPSIPGATSIVDRVDYSNDTATMSAKGPLSLARRGFSATGNISYGYWGGGRSQPGPDVSTVGRLDYSSDTTAAVVKGPLSAATNYTGSTGNTSYGYFGGGLLPPGASTVNRIDYSNDTPTTPTKGPLSLARSNVGATGTTSYGYFGGGQVQPTAYSTLDRIDYSSDTGTTPTKGPLSAARYGPGATGNASYGWWTGGYNTSIVDRIDYSSDTTTASARGPLSAKDYGSTATGNTSYGYVAVSATPSGTLVNRIDYSSDTPTAAVKGPLSLGRIAVAATSPRINGFPSTSRSDNQGIISYSDSGGNEDATTCQFDVNANGKVMFSGSGEVVTSASAPTVDTWVHTAVTRSGSAVSLYINGILEDTGTSSQDFSDYAKVTIGANRPRNTFYKGDISQIQIYKGKALSSDQIQQNFRSIKKRFGL